jgi:trimeric autotransporter adhesin
MRGLLAPAAILSLLLASQTVRAQADLILTTDGQITSGTYHNVEIRPGVNGTISGAVTVTGTFLVDSAGAVAIGAADYIAGNNFAMANDSKLNVGNLNGISAPGGTGPIRTANRNFGTKARITFNNSTSAQITGMGFPDEVSELVINNANGVTMSRDINVRERLYLRNGSLIVNGHILTLISREPDIAQVTSASALIFNQNGNVVGNVTAQRYINPRYNAGIGYRHFTSSVTGSAVNDLQTAGFAPVVNPQYNTVPYSQRFVPGNVLPYPNSFFYDESQVGTGGAGTSDQVFVQGYQSPNSAQDVLNPTQGISVRINADQVVDFVGAPNDGIINTGPLTRGMLNESGWHLVGNPYPSKIDWTLLNRTNMFNQFAKYRSTGPTAGLYDMYVNGVGTGPSGNEFIAANQAVFARVATPGVVGSIQFTNLARLQDFRDDPTAPFFRGTSALQARPLTRLAIEGANNLHDEAVVYFEQGATNGIDTNFDGFYINGGYPVGIYSQVGTEQLAIDGRPALTAATDHTIPFVVNILTAGTYTINAQEMLNFPAGFQVLLQDAVTGLSQDLTQTATYSFTSTGANANNTRFSVRFRAAGVTGLSESITASGFEVFPNPVKGTDRLNVVLPGIESGQLVQAAMYNQLGQAVWTSTLRATLGGVREEIKAPVSGGVYTLQVTLPNGSKQSRRVIVK